MSVLFHKWSPEVVNFNNKILLRLTTDHRLQAEGYEAKALLSYFQTDSGVSLRTSELGLQEKYDLLEELN